MVYINGDIKINVVERTYNCDLVAWDIYFVLACCEHIHRSTITSLSIVPGVKCTYFNNILLHDDTNYDIWNQR